MEQNMGDICEQKPIPMPRKNIQNLAQKEGTNSGSSNKGEKPIPSPRKLLQKFNPIPERWRSSKVHAMSNIPESQPQGVVDDDVKRGTINLFNRAKTIDPFEEFESIVQDPGPGLLRDVSFSSPLSGLTDAEKARLSGVSSSSSLTYSSSDSSDFNELALRQKNTTNVRNSLDGRQSAYDNVNIITRPVTPPSDQVVNGCKENEDDDADERDEGEHYEPLVFFNSTFAPVNHELTIIKSSSFSKRATVPVAEKPKNTLSTTSLNASFNFKETDESPDVVKDDQYNTSFVNLNSEKLEPFIPKFQPKSENFVTNRTSNFYDQVAVEDGTVVFLDNQLNTRPRVSPGRGKLNRSSVVMEFDPLFTPPSSIVGAKSSSLELMTTIAGNLVEENTEDNEGRDSFDFEFFNACRSRLELDSVIPEYHFYYSIGETEPVEHQDYEECVVESGFISPLETKPISISMASQANPEYYPVSFETNKDIILNDIVMDLRSNKPITTQPITASCPALNQSLDESQSEVDGPGEDNPNQSNIKKQGSFLKRISQKIKLRPAKEERNSASNSSSSLSSTENIPGKPQHCEICSEQHPEGSKCKFNPKVKTDVNFAGFLLKKTGILQKDFGNKRWTVLLNGKLQFLNDKRTTPVEEIPLQNILAISKRDDIKVANNELKCFGVNLFGAKNTLILASITAEDRSLWLQKYVQTFTGSAYPEFMISSIDQVGWCYLKESVTSKWRPALLVLQDRAICYCYHNEPECELPELDLRKARSITINNSEDNGLECPFVENFDVLTLDICGRIYYIQTESSKVTSAWEKTITAAAKQNGSLLQDMQLTGENIPVAVDKLINFLYAHGTLSEGIYRQSGANTRISQLLAALNTDAWSVQVQIKDYSAHDVASVLKRFFRTLPEPLLTTRLYEQWIDAAKCTTMPEKLTKYAECLELLPEINFNTLKKLICHLYAIHDVHEKNLMPIQNLAPIWGPTLMTVEVPIAGPGGSQQQYMQVSLESTVVGDLIDNFHELFKIDQQSRERERKMQEALETFRFGSTKSKNSGDMKIWIYIWEKDETTAINITLTPNSTSSSIVQQLCVIAKIRTTENLALHEVVCQKNLERPLHPSDIVIETVLRWSLWDIDERKDNFLILKKNTLYPALIPYAKDPISVFGEFKYADSKSKSFRKYYFKFEHATLKYFKDAKATVELGSWKIEDIVWYMGSEPKRTPPSRSREEPYFGNVVTCNSEEELHKWIAAMVIGEHPAGLYPLV